MPLHEPASLRGSLRPGRGRTLTTSASNAHTLASTVLLTASGVSYALIPGARMDAAVGLLHPGFYPLWVAGLIVGGLLSSYGVLFGRAPSQIVGLCLLGASVVFAALAVFDVRAATAVPVALIYLSSGLSCFARVWGIVYLERLRDRIQRTVEARPQP